MQSIKLTRRRFIRGITGAGMAFSLAKFSTPVFGQNSEMDTSRRLMLFSKQLEWIKDYDELSELAAEIGFDGFELTVRPGGHVLPEKVEDDLPRAVEAARKAGIDIIMITTKITDPGDPITEKILNTASQLGIEFYRMGGLNYNESRTIEQNLEEYKAVFQDLAKMNEQYRIHGAYQNHAGSNRISASIWDLWFILKGLDPRWIGCQYDTRHSQLEGGSWWPIGLQLLNPYVKTTVVKDFKWIQNGDQWKVQNCPIGEGVVDFHNYFSIIKKYNINGPISLHFPYPLMEDIDKLSKNKRFEKTKAVMKQKGVIQLKAMLQQAGLS